MGRALRKLRHSLDPHKTEFLYVADSRLSPRWLYNSFLEQLGCKGYFYRGDGKKALHDRFAVISTIEKKSICCVIDEAHLLDLQTIEELRFFLNCNIDSYTPVALILAGQPELKLKLQREMFTAIRQRVNMVCSLHPLDRIQTGKYMKTHLKYSGCASSDLFSEEAVDDIFAYSNGIPRMINNACSQALLCAASQNLQRIDGCLMNAVIENELI